LVPITVSGDPLRANQNYVFALPHAGGIGNRDSLQNAHECKDILHLRSIIPYEFVYPSPVRQFNGRLKKGLSLVTLRSRLARLGCALLILAAVSGAAAGEAFNREALWLVVRSCVIAKVSLGTALPCLEIDVNQGTGSGVAVLRVPLASTHLLVVPLRQISGLESPALQSPDSGRYWQAAWEARHFILEDFPKARVSGAIGLAANSKFVRSQDQFHIHVDCVQGSVERILSLKDAAFDRNWRMLPFPIEGRRYYGRKIAMADLVHTNLIGSLLKEQPAALDTLPELTMAVIGMPASGGETVFYALASQAREPNRGAEMLLDHTCSARPIMRN
jgi:CDP-diacylglycerol pyrophosphatase